MRTARGGARIYYKDDILKARELIYQDKPSEADLLEAAVMLQDIAAGLDHDDGIVCDSDGDWHCTTVEHGI